MVFTTTDRFFEVAIEMYIYMYIYIYIYMYSFKTFKNLSGISQNL